MQVGRVEFDPKTGRIVVLRAGAEPVDDDDARFRRLLAEQDG